MKIFLDMLGGLLIALVTSFFAQLGVNLDLGDHKTDRPTVHRTTPANVSAPASATASPSPSKASYVTVRRVQVRQAEQKGA